MLYRRSLASIKFDNIFINMKVYQCGHAANYTGKVVHKKSTTEEIVIDWQINGGYIDVLKHKLCANIYYLDK